MAARVSPIALERLLGRQWRRRRATGAGLADALRALVVEGRLAARTRLPSERALAEHLGLSRGTVSRAYDLLREDGHLVSSGGAGSVLTLPGDPAPTAQEPDRVRPGVLDLTVAAPPAPELQLGPAAQRAATRITRYAGGRGYVPEGLPELRAAVAERFRRRGLPTEPDEILITAGAQHAMHLLLSLLAAPGDRVLVDAPTYPRTLAAISGARARAVAVPLGHSRWHADAWAQSLALTQPRLAVTAPDFHNPTGLTMAHEDRRRIVATCRAAGVLLVADETMSELRLDGPATPPPLAAFGPAGAVASVGSLSKAAWGGLRLGWIRARPSLIRELAQIRTAIDMANPVLDQLLAVELLADLDDILVERRRMLRMRRDVLLRALAEHAPAWTVRRPRGGMCAWVRLPDPTATPLAAEAAREHLRITAGPAFAIDGTFEHHVRLPFVAAPEVLTTAVAQLASIARRITPRSAGGAAERQESAI